MVTILVIEHSAKDIESFAPSLERKGFEVYSVRTGKSAINQAKKLKPEAIVLNAASFGTSGDRICGQLNDSLNGIPIIHIRSARHAVGDENAGPADVSLDMPFTSRKLINRIHALLPDDLEEILVQGPVKLNVTQRIVRTGNREKHLTPKCASLLEQFLRRPNETLSRSFLMKRVWKTDYVGDTRTLDVHVRWLREAIERKPTKPRILVTVRGEGYRFDVPQAASKTTSRRTKKKRKS